jgi:hypothetical protein
MQLTFLPFRKRLKVRSQRSVVPSTDLSREDDANPEHHLPQTEISPPWWSGLVVCCVEDCRGSLDGLPPDAGTWAELHFSGWYWD